MTYFCKKFGLYYLWAVVGFCAFSPVLAMEEQEQKIKSNQVAGEGVPANLSNLIDRLGNALFKKHDCENVQAIITEMMTVESAAEKMFLALCLRGLGDVQHQGPGCQQCFAIFDPVITTAYLRNLGLRQ